jgi:hypothetical protein
MEMEVLPLNMLQVLERFDEEKGKIREELFNKEIGQLQMNGWANLFRSLNFDGLMRNLPLMRMWWNMREKQRMMHKRSCGT